MLGLYDKSSPACPESSIEKQWRVGDPRPIPGASHLHKSRSTKAQNHVGTKIKIQKKWHTVWEPPGAVPEEPQPQCPDVKPLRMSQWWRTFWTVGGLMPAEWDTLWHTREEHLVLRRTFYGMFRRWSKDRKGDNLRWFGEQQVWENQRLRSQKGPVLCNSCSCIYLSGYSLCLVNAVHAILTIPLLALFLGERFVSGLCKCLSRILSAATGVAAIILFQLIEFKLCFCYLAFTSAMLIKIR